MKPLPESPMERVALGIATLCDGISEGNWERLEALRAVVAMPSGPGSHASRPAACSVDGPSGFDPYRGAGE
jgi:hypothetical protein